MLRGLSFQLAVVVALAAPSLAQKKVKALVELLDSKNRAERNAARDELARTRPESGPRLLAEAAPKFSLTGQSVALYLLRLYPSQDRAPAMHRILESDQPLLICAAGASLYRTRDPKAVAGIVRGLQKPSPQELAMILPKLANVRAPAVSDAVLKLVRNDKRMNVVRQGLRFLLRLKHVAAVPVVTELLTDGERSADQRAMFATFLTAMGARDRPEDLAKAIRGTKNFALLQEFLNAAPTLDDTVLAAVLDYAKSAPGNRVRPAVQILAKHRYRDAASMLFEMLESKDRLRSDAAFSALMQMGGGYDDAKKLRRMLASENPRVRIVAADGLRRMDDLSGLAPLLELAKAHSATKAQSATKDRLEVIDALAKFRARSVVPVLIDALNDSDRNVRMRAQRGLQSLLTALHPYRRFDLAAAGYRANDPAAARKTATETIRRWWAAQEARVGR